MSRTQVWLFHGANALVSVTGLVWAFMLYALDPVDEFSLQNHPLQDEMQAAHVLTAPLFLVMLGCLWAVHALPHLARGTRARRRSGIGLLFIAVPMAASGYLLQTSVDDGWRSAWLFVHLATSALWLIALVLHLTRPRTSALDPHPTTSG